MITTLLWTSSVQADHAVHDSVKTVFTRQDMNLKRIGRPYLFHDPPRICFVPKDRSRGADDPHVIFEDLAQKETVAKPAELVEDNWPVLNSTTSLERSSFDVQYAASSSRFPEPDQPKTSQQHTARSILIPNPTTIALMLTGCVVVFWFKPREKSLNQ
jgi:hypothetical protein